MDMYAGTSLELKNYKITKDSIVVEKEDYTQVTMVGEMTTRLQRKCKCGGEYIALDTKSIILKHLPLPGQLIRAKVIYKRRKCNCCGNIIEQKIPFKSKDHNTTKFYEREKENAGALFYFKYE